MQGWDLSAQAGNQIRSRKIAHSRQNRLPFPDTCTCVGVMTDKKSVLTVVLTEEQKYAVEAFFAHNDWDFEILHEEPYITSSSGGASNPVLENGQSVSHDNDGDQKINCERQRVAAAHQAHVNQEQFYEPDPDACPYCFLNPCVATVRQGWLGEGQAARMGNNSIRKEKYRKYWSVMSALGAWNHPLYVAKKMRALGHQDENNEIVWAGRQSIREIMPECVLKLVQGLYPNLPGVPYMGHKFW